MKKILTTTLLLLTMISGIAAQPLPQDSTIRKGTLKNGMTYYIRHNAKEAGLADFYIAYRVGAIQEEPRQRGLAHFLEHMAFNGTKNFPGKGKKLGIVPWAESIGVKFGANLNAYTSVEQTVYHIGAAPLKREGVIDSCLLVLHDWSHYLLLEDNEIDKERGVIHEEWRTRRAGKAVQRLMEQAMPKIYKGTKYEDCMPIGSMDIVDNFPYQDLRDYYQKWYRPDLQAIVVVGDFDVDKMEKKIKKIFSPIPLAKKRAERIYYPVNDNDTMIVDIEKDSEQPINLFHLYQKRDATPDAEKNTVQYIRGEYVDNLISTMLNDRLAEMRQQAAPPFQSATARSSAFFVSRTKDAFSLSVGCNQDSILSSIAAAVGVAEQARQHGFTESELSRAKSVYLNGAERRYKQRNDYRNNHYVSKCVNNYLSFSPLLSVEQELGYIRTFDSEVTLDEVNRAAKEMITDKNQVAILYAPDKETVPLPTEKEIEQAVLTAQQRTYEPYAEEAVGDKLVTDLPAPGTIVSEKPYKHGFTEMTLSNGMKVYTRKTDFSSDAVSMTMKAEGGTSVYGDEDIPNFNMIASAVSEGGVGDYDLNALRKMLTGKSVKIVPAVGTRGQSIGGGASVKDAKTMFELAYLFFTSPRRDTTAFRGLINRQRAFLANRNASPKVDYNDSCYVTLYDHHPRRMPFLLETLDKVSYDRCMEIYKERFSDASNFKTVIIGNYEEEEMRTLICQYLATLPSTYKNEKTNWANVPQIAGGKKLVKFTKKQATPLANVSIYLTADIPFTPQADLELDFLNRVLQVMYTDSIREEKGGTYGVSVGVNFDKDDHPTAMLRIAYNADPQRYEELNPIVYQQLENVAKHGPSEETLKKIKQYLVKQYAQAAITNDYWNYIIWHELDDDTDFDKDYCKMVEAVTPGQVQRIAQRMLDAQRRIEVTMLSE